MHRNESIRSLTGMESSLEFSIRFGGICLFAFLLAIVGTASGQTLRTFTEDTDTFPNPERGLFWGLEEASSMPQTPIRNTCISTRNARRSLVARYYYFPGAYNTPLPQSTLDFIERDMDTVRAYGLKLILKFGYGISNNFVQATMAQIFTHIDQLAPILQGNADVIAFIETGWIGAWGEWHSSSPTGNNVLGYDTSRAQQLALVQKYLSVLPVEKKIQVRTVMFKNNMFNRRTPTTFAESHSDLSFARVGFHNDAFISGSNWNDQGTWADSAVNKTFLRGDSKYTPSGGETDGTARVSCANYFDEAVSQHYSFYNGNFYAPAHTMLRNEGCWPNVLRRLGYRFILDSVRVPTTAIAGGDYRVRVYMRNDGFAAPVYPRKLYLVLRNANRSYSFLLDNDLRYRLPDNGPIAYDSTFKVPDDFVQDTYQTYVWCPDSYPSLAGDPRYAVRFANTGVWNATLGMNALGVSVVPSDQQAAPVLLSPSDGSTGQSTSTTLVWSEETGATQYHLQVSTSSAFTTFVVNDSTLIDTTDQVAGLSGGTTYFWRVRARGTTGWSAFASTFDFATVVPLPDGPTVTSPTSGATNQPTTVDVRWNTVSSAQRYRVQLATDASFTQVMSDDSSLSRTWKRFRGLPYGTMIYCRTRARSAQGWGAFGPTTQFATSGYVKSNAHFVGPTDDGHSAVLQIPLSATISVLNQPIQHGDEIAVFTQGGLCAGTGEWNGNELVLTLRGDDPATPAVDGLQQNEPLRLRIWKSSQDFVYGATTTTFATGGGTYTEGGTNVLSSLTVTTQPMLAEQTIRLQAGWNMISANCEPTDPQFASIFSGIAPNFEMLKDGNGEIYWPVFDIREVSYWNYLQGYQVNMQAADSLTVTGFEISTGRGDVPLVAGWNLVPCLLKDPAPIDEVLAPIASSITIVKNNAGDVYWPANGINTIGMMNPGEAYLIYPNENKMLVFGATPSGLASSPGMSGNGDTRQTISAHYGGAPKNTGNNAVVLVVGQGLRDGDEVAVRTATGVIAGWGTVASGKAVVTVWGDDPTTSNVIEGALDNAELRLERWNAVNQREELLTVDALNDVLGNSATGTLTYRTNSLWTASVSSAAMNVPEAFALSQNYPNPFNPSTTIRFALPNSGATTLKVYNALGEEIAVLASGQYDAGSHAVVWDAGNQPSGIYFARLQAGSFMETKKLMLVK